MFLLMSYVGSLHKKEDSEVGLCLLSLAFVEASSITAVAFEVWELDDLLPVSVAVTFACCASIIFNTVRR